MLVDDGEATCGNPCPIVDRKTGAIVLLITKNGRDDAEFKIMRGTAPPRTAWVLRSEDDGVTWSAPREISAQVRTPAMRWYATGPGHGLQLKDGRLIAPCDHSTGPTPDEVHSHVIYSDDAGATWALGGVLPGRTDESIAEELAASGTSRCGICGCRIRWRRASSALTRLRVVRLLPTHPPRTWIRPRSI